jgi:D-alanine-D-alanine ligase
MLTFRDNVIATDPEAVRAIVSSTGMFRPNEVDVAVELVEERLQRGESSGYHFVFACDDARVIGYICYGHISVTLHSYDLYWIVVDPTRQGQGLGRQLLREAEERIAALGGRQIYIETSGQDIYVPTRRFYDRCQYQLVATVPDFYAPGDDKLIYVRKLGLDPTD